MKKQKRKKRANKIFVRFKTPVPNQSLANLASDPKFTGKFIVVDVIKHNENVMAIHMLDNDQIDYTLSINGIDAFSVYQRDKTVKQKIEEFTKELLPSLGRRFDDYEIDDWGEHNYIRNFQLSKIIDDDFRKKIIEIFKEKGYGEPSFISITIIAEGGKTSGTKLVLRYPDEMSFKNNELLVESNKLLIKEVTKILKNV